jgi:hypothetical protein
VHEGSVDANVKSFSFYTNTKMREANVHGESGAFAWILFVLGYSLVATLLTRHGGT